MMLQNTLKGAACLLLFGQYGGKPEVLQLIQSHLLQHSQQVPVARKFILLFQSKGGKKEKPFIHRCNYSKP